MPGFTDEQAAVIEQINDQSAHGVEEPLIFSEDEEGNAFSLDKMKRYLRQLLDNFRSALGNEIQLFPDNMIQTRSGEFMGAIPDNLAAAIERQFAPERQAAIATYQANTSALLQEHGLFSSDANIRTTQENLLFGQGVTPQMTPESLNLSKEQSSEALSISNHLKTRFENRYKNESEQERPPVKAFVERQFLAAGIALAMSGKTLDDLRDKEGRDIAGGVLDQLTDHMLERARVTTSNPSPVVKLEQSVSQLQASNQKVNNEHNQKMQGILNKEYTDQRGQNPYKILSPDPKVQNVQRQLMSGTVNASNPIAADLKELGQAVQNSRPAPHPQYSGKIIPERELKVEASLNESHLETVLREEFPATDQRTLAILQGVRDQIPATALALALSANEDVGKDVMQDCVRQMYKTSEDNYKATQACLRDMPKDPSALSDLHQSNDPQVLETVVNVYTQIDNVVSSMGGEQKPVSELGPQVSTAPTMRPS